MAVTEKDLLLYDAMPWTRDAWASPCHSYPLVATRYRDGDSCGSRPHTWDAAPTSPPLPRLVHSGSGRRSPSLGSELTFATRTGSRQGIEMHVFRVETHRDLSCWTRVLVQGCHAAAELIKEVSVGECTPASGLCPWDRESLVAMVACCMMASLPPALLGAVLCCLGVTVARWRRQYQSHACARRLHAGRPGGEALHSLRGRLHHLPR